MQTHQLHQQLSNAIVYSVALLLFCFTLMVPDQAHAIQASICKVVNLVRDDIGPPVASAAIIALALMAMFGRVTWGLVLTTNIGIGIIFSAAEIAATLTGKAAAC